MLAGTVQAHVLVGSAVKNVALKTVMRGMLGSVPCVFWTLVTFGGPRSGVRGDSLLRARTILLLTMYARASWLLLRMAWRLIVIMLSNVGLRLVNTRITEVRVIARPANLLLEANLSLLIPRATDLMLRLTCLTTLDVSIVLLLVLTIRHPTEEEFVPSSRTGAATVRLPSGCCVFGLAGG